MPVSLGMLAPRTVGQSVGCLFLAERGVGSHHLSKADPQVKRTTWKKTSIKHCWLQSWKIAFKFLAPRWEKDLREGVDFSVRESFRIGQIRIKKL